MHWQSKLAIGPSLRHGKHLFRPILLCNAKQSVVLSRQVVCPIMTLRYRGHTGWNSSKKISWSVCLGQYGLSSSYNKPTPFGYCPSTAFIPVWPHYTKATQNRCQDLNNFALGELEETTSTPSYYVDEDYSARPEIQ